MRNKSLFRYFILGSLSLILVASCVYDETVLPPPPAGVSFSKDVIPVFNSNCSLSGCHNGVDHAPDLRASAAYDALWEGGFIDTIAPENSGLYLWMAGLKGLPMPPSGVIQTDVDLVRQWIAEGALNN